MKHAFNLFALTAAMMFIALAGTNIWAFGIPDPRGSDTVLIVPARPGVLRLAFDLVKMRNLTLVSFRGKANSAEPLIHVWTGNEWQHVGFDDFCSLRFAGQAPKTAIVIGDDQTVPKALLQGMDDWSGKESASGGRLRRIERMQTMNISDLINGLNPYLEFSSREWKRLADSYGLKLEDINAPKRAFNPYNTPRSKLPLETHEFKQEKGDTPPAVLIEKPGV